MNKAERDAALAAAEEKQKRVKAHRQRIKAAGWVQVWGFPVVFDEVYTVGGWMYFQYFAREGNNDFSTVWRKKVANPGQGNESFPQ